jgi:exodeoxyribonuclease VII large subunit
VPVLADLRLTIDSHRNRTERCARRYVERGREQLTALARLLPKRDQLLGPQRQRADDFGQRLDRGLERRLTLARGTLDRSAGALRPATLEHRLEAKRAQLDATWRLVQSLNPDNILDRGYARITARPGGETLASAKSVRAAGGITLLFRDGAVDARVERTPSKTYDKGAAEQPSLL